MLITSQVLTRLPETPNRYHDDPGLGRLLKVHLTSEARNWADPVLDRMGAASAGVLDELSHVADKNPPRLAPRDRFGNRVDHLEFHPAYREMQRIAYGEGIVGAYYDPQVRQVLKAGREAVKFAQGYLFAQAEQGLYCPVCMTDGAAYLIEKYATAEQRGRFLPRLTSRDPDTLWEGAMFLTEKAGGSDVGATETVAHPQSGDRYALSGEKWFCSNAGAELVMVLARPVGAPEGTTGLGLFAMRRHLEDGRLNHLHLERLKDKLGTRSMPTGEVILNGSEAESIGKLSRGFVQMADMLNISRLYNATASVAVMRRATTESVRYAAVRHTFQKALIFYPMVQAKLVELATEQEAALHLMFWLYRWRGKALCDTADPSQLQLLRMFTPIAKLTTGRQAVWAASEAVELHGGCGYIEDWPLARLFRDAQVLPIWEGTTNILALDTVRSLAKENCHEAFLAFVEQHNQDESVKLAAAELKASVPRLVQQPQEPASLNWCWQASRVLQATLLQMTATEERARLVAEQYLRRHFASDRTSLTPSWLDHAGTHYTQLLGLP
ncbi:MAG: acyl-CoA dehydrogenase family protein [Candidatus Eremiobacterota bacterium]